MERIPSSLLENDILSRLELETLCSLSCVSKSLRFSVSQLLLSQSDLQFPPTFSPDERSLISIVERCGKTFTNVTLSCLNLREHESISRLFSRDLLHLSLFCCASFSPQIIMEIARLCPNLRDLTLELADYNEPHKVELLQSLCRVLHLDTLCVKIRGTGGEAFRLTDFKVPKTVKVLKLEMMLEYNAAKLVHDLSYIVDEGISPLTGFSRLQSLSLVLDIISDRILQTIVNFFPLLTELDLEDRPNEGPLLDNDLTNTGVQSLCSCSHLKSLSLVRVGKNRQVSFKSVNDMSMFLISEGCKRLESVKLCGFSKVSDAGFTSILNSCKRLKKIEVRNASLLSDLAFHGLTEDLSDLIEVKLLSCNLITSETVQQMANSRSLEVLNLGGCRSVADSSFNSISCLHRLTTLVLSGLDITDSGLSVLGHGTMPIARLSLRGCKRVTNKGISLLLHGRGTIGKSLSSLDLGYMLGISDESIHTIAAVCIGLTELCIRFCFYVTDSSFEALAKRKSREGFKLLRWLDLYHCTALSAESLKWLRKGSSSIHGLHWLGVGRTRAAYDGYDSLTEICRERPWLVLCLDGCEMGCQDGWQFRKTDSS